VGHWLGPTPVAEARAATAALRDDVRGPVEEAALSSEEGVLLAMEGSFDEARSILERARRTYDEFRLEMYAHGIALQRSFVEFAASDLTAAEHVLRESCDRFRAMGETGYLSTNVGYLGQALYRLGRYDEADEAARESQDLTQKGDAASETLWRSLRAKVLARRGRPDEALPLAREAIAWAETTDSIQAIGDAYADYAEVLRLAERDAEAVEALEHALELYVQKGHQPFAERTRAELAELRPSTTSSA
jgi:tetratricopeptide (TPR) repeat protein